MARVIEEASEKRVRCRDCRAMIGYMPEEVQKYSGRDISGGPDGYERVKCPRPGCPGHGYIREW